MVALGFERRGGNGVDVLVLVPGGELGGEDGVPDYLLGGGEVGGGGGDCCGYVYEYLFGVLRFLLVTGERGVVGVLTQL